MKDLKTKPLVTIVTVTFNLLRANREHFFRECLLSVHNQTYQNIEHIIIDGASSDGTLELIKEYKQKGWINYISEPDKGIYEAMNKGARLAKGKYVTFLNSDDYYNDKTGILRSVDALEKTGSDFSYAPINMVNEDGSTNFFQHPFQKPEIKNCFFVMPFCHQTMLTKRDALIKEKLFDTTYKNAGDYDLVIRLCLKNYKSVFIKDAFATFRFGGFSEINQSQNAKEVAESYFNNFSKICSITEKECKKIYCKGYVNIPKKLAEKLKKLPQYFDYNQYQESIKPINRIKANSKFLRSKLNSEFKSFSTTPKKYLKKRLRIK